MIENSEVVGVLWPLDWSAEQWTQKKEKHTWLFCQNGLLGCKTCFQLNGLKHLRVETLKFLKNGHRVKLVDVLV